MTEQNGLTTENTEGTEVRTEKNFEKFFSVHVSVSR